MTYQQILNKTPEDLLEYLGSEFGVKLPESVNTIEDMENASMLMIKLTGNYSYLSSLLSCAKYSVRQLKREGNKLEAEDMIDKRDMIEGFVNAVKQQYAAISRAVTIHIENNRELQMNASGYIKGECS